MQLDAMEKVAIQFNAQKQSPKYQIIFKSVFESDGASSHHNVNCKIRLRIDQPWIPDFFVTFIRNLDNYKNNR